MKPRTVIVIAAISFFACFLSAYLGWHFGIHSRVISRETATTIALDNIGDASRKNAHLERNKGMPVWEINFVKTGDRRNFEVRVHALTGEVLEVHTESVEKANAELAEVIDHLGMPAEFLKTRRNKTSEKLTEEPRQPNPDSKLE